MASVLRYKLDLQNSVKQRFFEISRNIFEKVAQNKIVNNFSNLMAKPINSLERYCTICAVSRLLRLVKLVRHVESARSDQDAARLYVSPHGRRP